MEKNKPSWLRPLVEHGPLVLFFVVYVSRDLMAATAVLIGAAVLALGLSLAMERRVPAMPLVTAVLVGIFGGLTLWLRDETFIKMKPTIVQCLFAAALLIGLTLKKPLPKIVLGSALRLTDRGWCVLSWRWAAFFLAMAGLNEAVWRTQPTDFWVSFKVFGILVLTVVFALAQTPVLMRHRQPEEAAEGD